MGRGVRPLPPNLAFQLRGREVMNCCNQHHLHTFACLIVSPLWSFALVFMGVLHLWKIYCTFPFSFTFANAFTWEPLRADSRPLSDTELFGILNENPFQGLRFKCATACSAFRFTFNSSQHRLVFNFKPSLHCFNVCCLIAPTDCLVLYQYSLCCQCFHHNLVLKHCK